MQPAQVMRERIEGGNIEAAAPRPDYAELAATEGQGISRERERLHSAVEHAQEQQHAEELSHAGVSPELAAEYEARILARDESFSGEVVQQIERDDEGREEPPMEDRAEMDKRICLVLNSGQRLLTLGDRQLLLPVIASHKPARSLH